MHKLKKMDHNMRFLLGGVLFFFAIIFTVILFSGLSLKMYWERNGTRSTNFTVVLAEGFVGQPLSVYVNDSLLLNEPVNRDSMRLNVRCAAEENALIVVNSVTDSIIGMFNIGKQGEAWLTCEGGKVHAKINGE